METLYHEVCVFKAKTSVFEGCFSKNTVRIPSEYRPFDHNRNTNFNTIKNLAFPKVVSRGFEPPAPSLGNLCSIHLNYETDYI